jgi:predicted ABC-type ATPase
MSHVIIIAGPNGAGKTTTAPALLNKALTIHNFVNADTIAAGFCAFAPETAAIQAGRAMLNRIHYLAEQNEDFAFETTLASRSFAPWIKKLKKKGYLFHLEFLWLENADLAVSRVQERIKIGGHFVPEATIRRRYASGLKNFFNLYESIADSWRLYNNSNMNHIIPIALKQNNQLEIYDDSIWQTLVETYDETSKT